MGFDTFFYLIINFGVKLVYSLYSEANTYLLLARIWNNNIHISSYILKWPKIVESNNNKQRTVNRVNREHQYPIEWNIFGRLCVKNRFQGFHIDRDYNCLIKHGLWLIAFFARALSIHFERCLFSRLFFLGHNATD